jgi:hypothetical protein
VLYLQLPVSNRTVHFLLQTLRDDGSGGSSSY